LLKLYSTRTLKFLEITSKKPLVSSSKKKIRNLLGKEIAIQILTKMTI